jgi:SAM-dependent methyltransferase
MAENDDKRVHDQYEAYPYPARDPAEEARRLVTGSPSSLAELNHYVFAGGRDFTQPFHALVAGGGTGDAAIMLAQQLTDSGGPGEVVHLDLSESSAAIARARAEARGLTNIRFVHGSLLDAKALGLGPFDYIDCCGVLHHLDDPAAGLRALTNVLAPDGGMGLMLYAPLGRAGVYEAQAMLRMLGDGDPLPDRVAQARTLMAQLPPTNRLRTNPYVGDHLLTGDAGLVDLLLHPRDRAFTVPEIDALARGAGLSVAAFIEPLRYDPQLHIRDAALAAKLRALPWIERCAFAELLYASHKTHVFYAVPTAKAGASIARPDDPACIPVAIGCDPQAVAARAREGGTLRAELDGLKLAFPLAPEIAPMLNLIDGARSLGDIHAALRDTVGPTDWADFAALFGHVFAMLNGLNLMFLRRVAD